MERNNNLNDMNGFQNPKATNKKNNSSIIVIGLVILMTAIAALAFFIFNDSKKNDTDQDTENNNKVEDVVWNGVYESEQGKIYLYQLNDDMLSFVIEVEGANISGSADIDDNQAVGEIFDTYSFILKHNSLELTSTSEDIKDGTFTRAGDYSTKDYYSDNYGDPQYLESNINGIFGNDTIIIKIYQQSEEKAYISFCTDDSIFSRNIDIINGELVLEEESFGDIDKIHATIQDDILVITASSTDNESILNKINGSYNKTAAYTMEDIIKNEF